MIWLYPRLPTLRSISHQCRQKVIFTHPLQQLPPPTNRLLSTSSSSPAGGNAMADTSFLENSLSSLSHHPTFKMGGRVSGQKLSLAYRPPPKPHHLHIYAKRHNCHITLTSGNRDAVLSVSSGTLNFRKASRGNYDSSFQLCAFVMAKIKNMGLLSDAYSGKGGPIRALEVCFRDFGPGREAMRKILLGQEGAQIRKKVVRVMDGTRLKFGGTRSKKPRRLG